MSAASRQASLISICVLAALASALLVAVISTPAAGQPPTKQPRTTKAKAGAATTPPIASRTWNSRGLGALIEGVCVGVDGEHVRIVTGEIERRVPFELFHAEDLETIRAHFSIADPFPKQATTDPAPRGECRMLHTIRGGVLPEAKVGGQSERRFELARGVTPHLISNT